MAAKDYTQKLTQHINGGSDFSQFHYRILKNNEPTGITRNTRTDGSPHYRIVSHELHFGSDTYDILKEGIQGMLFWIEERAGKEPPK